MLKIPALVLTVGFLGVASFSCKQAPIDTNVNHEDGLVANIAPSDSSLIGIMRGLEADLAEVAHGLWTQDPQVVKAAAIRIADHPKVTAEQLLVIKQELGAEIGAFVQFDQVVHNSAIDLATAVDSASSIVDMFEIYHRVETGCISCHSAFQTRVSDALVIGSNGS